jgi:hypothetical protein
MFLLRHRLQRSHHHLRHHHQQPRASSDRSTSSTLPSVAGALFVDPTVSARGGYLPNFAAADSRSFVGPALPRPRASQVRVSVVEKLTETEYRELQRKVR